MPIDWLATLAILLAQDISSIRVHGGRVSAFVTRIAGAAAITLGHRILLSPAAQEALENETDAAFELLAHELVHVAQMAHRGVLVFLADYAREYLGHRMRGLRHGEAYRALSAEVEARYLARLCARAVTTSPSVFDKEYV